MFFFAGHTRSHGRIPKTPTIPIARASDESENDFGEVGDVDGYVAVETDESKKQSKWHLLIFRWGDFFGGFWCLKKEEVYLIRCRIMAVRAVKKKSLAYKTKNPEKNPT